MKDLGLALLGVLTLAGCGYVGDPKPPSLQIPPAPTTFSARQVGGRILGEFTAGDMTTDKAPLHLMGGAVRIGSREVPVAAMPGAVAHFTVDSAEWAGQSVMVAARLRGASGRWSAWSNEIALAVEAAVAPPRAFTAKLLAKGIELSWEPGAPDARGATIARRVVGEPGFSAAGTAAGPPWVDEAVELGKRYEYQIQSKKGDAVSEPAAQLATLLFEDKFAPAAPKGLDAVAGLTSIELSWDLNEDGDFAGFIIYRAEPLDEFARLAGPAPLPSYSDRTPRAGVSYRYAVSAIDKTGNESARSAAVQITLPAP